MEGLDKLDEFERELLMQFKDNFPRWMPSRFCKAHVDILGLIVLMKKAIDSSGGVSYNKFLETCIEVASNNG